ncbi:MAG: 2,3-bisphosphoglycerate-independent phosphoglycerate mutase [Bacteroidetes bacterium]|nr:2,3-bisphosphoglycerate-independent phosphoglycerate mutase [Bacteroidota bacterium]
MKKKVILIILDGWGHGPEPAVSAIAQGNTPFIDSLYDKYPNSELLTHSEHVGLPNGQMGNSEVGHMNIGAGRIVYQELLRINKAIEDRSIFSNSVLNASIEYAINNGTDLHLMGLVSDGGIHSHIDHLKSICDLAKEKGLEKVYIHAFTDGRDTDPRSGLDFVNQLEEHLQNSAGKVASLVGRYYAMDRDKRWERIKKAYHLLIKGKGKEVTNIAQGLSASYDNDVTDEFIEPIIAVNADGKPIATIKENDAVICFNFRTDRCRQLTHVLTQQDMPEQEMKTIGLHYTTMTNYDESFTGVNIIFEKENVVMTLGEVLQKEGKKQIRIAETEKYPHVTFFFSGGREEPFDGEDRILIPSPKVATYDLQPEMSSHEVTTAIVKRIDQGDVDFICLNFANSDMVGHTGVFEAAVKAVETVDDCARQVVEAGLKNGYTMLVTADHGNSEYMINEDGTPNTAHTKFLVPLFLIGNNEHVAIKDGKLGDLAPTILTIMGIDIPEQMTGEVLI